MRVPLVGFPSSLPPLEPPIRAELFGIERLEQHAESLARAQVVRTGEAPGVALLSRVRENGRALQNANETLTTLAGNERWITPAAEWLLDNFFVVEAQLREIREALPEGFYRKLPALSNGPLVGYPRVYGIAWAFVAHTDSRFDPEALRRFVLAYQRVQPLTIGELWAVTISLRVVLVENLRRLADAIVRARIARQEANTLADELLGNSTEAPAANPVPTPRNDRAALFPAFAAELVHRLRDQDPAASPALAWLHRRLGEQGTTAEDIALVEHQGQAAMAVTVRNVITSMRLMSALDWSAFFESVSLVDDALRAESAFAAMDFTSRDGYRHAIESLALGSGRDELTVARSALAEANRMRDAAGTGGPLHDIARSDPGYYLIGRGRREFERLLGFRAGARLKLRRFFLDAATPGYLGTLLFLTGGLLLLLHNFALDEKIPNWELILLMVFAVIPASDLAIAVLNRIVTSLIKPTPLPRLEWPVGIPSDFRTMVVVPTLLTGTDAVAELVQRLEIHYLANADGDVRFALLTDWPDSPAEHEATDHILLKSVRDGIARLNAQYGATADGGARFYLFHRRRLWNASEAVWMGWERKRGKLHELNRLLRGATDTSFISDTDQPPESPPGVKYVLTLDTDTGLPIGAVKRLVGTMAHPLNQPLVDSRSQRVVEGYAVLQPRVTAPLPGYTGSIFQRLFSGRLGFDPYAMAVSDVYQDLFGVGSYTGKGIYDIDAFEQALTGRVPENTLLSHDLFEGVFARAGLVTDVELFESAPTNYLTSAARQDRWARGDWQLLPWILREHFSPIDRWKMVDNLRRSLSAPAMFATLVFGWLLEGSSPGIWTGFILTAIALPPLLPALEGIWPRVPGISKRSHVRAVASDFRSAFGQILFTVTTLAHQAWLMSDAAIRTLIRLYITHGRMLEWKTMQYAASQVPQYLLGFYRQMAGGLALSLVSVALIAWFRPEAWPWVLPFLMLWGLAPSIAYRVSRPGAERPPTTLTATDALELRLIARRTWRYFTTFVTAENHWLPPDNFQETPVPVVATRTSPTNIGLYLLSILSARDFGWLGLLDAADRIEATLGSVTGLEMFRGHIFNWYDTQTAHPMEPRYVSTVDSGNLAGSLITLVHACREMLDEPVVAPSALPGVLDGARLLREVANTPEYRNEGTDLTKSARLDEALDVIMSLGVQPADTAAQWSSRMRELEAGARIAENWAHDIDTGESASALAAEAGALRDTVQSHLRDLESILPWARQRVDVDATTLMASLGIGTPLSQLPERCEEALQKLAAVRQEATAHDGANLLRLRDLDQFAASLENSAAAASSLRKRLTDIADNAHAMVTRMEFGFLYDRVRMLFAIGYRMNEGVLDEGRYDLLASEARLTSFIAIAKGDVPVRHWFRLGRLLTPMGEDAVLVSWSGSMFEYLMPSLVMRTPLGSLLEQTCRLIVDRQIDYGDELGLPWGISESGYYSRDLAMTYQYSNFGVPGLGLKRGVADDVVVAPYATALAAMFQAPEAVKNFRAISRFGGKGDYGYYEAIDFTAARLPAGSTYKVVRMYMAHHQGMAIVAIGNVLHHDVMQNRFHAEAIIRASELLLQERTPRDVAVARPLPQAANAIVDVRELVPPHTRLFASPHTLTPRTHILSNGRYAVMVSAAGSGYSRWRDLAVTRWREDATTDETGSFISFRDVAGGERWSAGFQPSGVVPQDYRVSFTEDRAEFTRRDGAITTRMEIIVSTEDDAEVRRVSLTNHGQRVREIEVTSYAEMVLAPAAADLAHPAFSNLFVHTECIPERAALLVSRRRRAAEEAEVWLAHVVAVEGETIGELEWETERGQYLGRGRRIRSAHAETSGRQLANTCGSVLDPIVSLRRRIRLRPGRTVRVVFSTIVAADRESVLRLADKYNDITMFERAATLAWTQAQVQMHHIGIGADEANLFQTLGGAILYADRSLRAPGEVLARRTEGVPTLWGLGISGDLPIVLIEIDNADDIGIVRQLLRAHAYFRLKCMAIDLVILNDRGVSYTQDLQTLIETLARARQSTARTDLGSETGRVITLRADRMSSIQRDVLESAARISLSSRRGSLASQLARAVRVDSGLHARQPSAPVVATAKVSPMPRPALEFDNSFGGFDAANGEYVIILAPGQWTPAPWINVIANPDFGCLVSEAGSGCTWSVNSQENLLTPWSNDPVSDPPSEAIYLRDEDSGALWTPTPLPIRERNGEYRIRHGHGYTRVSYDGHGIASELLQFVPLRDSIKISRLTLRNHSSKTRRISVTGYLEWVLGVSRSRTAAFVNTEIDADTGAMFARNSWSQDFGNRIAFADLGGVQTSWTADRTEFIGRNNSIDAPVALQRRGHLAGRTGAGLDPCCALQAKVELPPNGERTIVFLLGQTASREEARTLIHRYRSRSLDDAFDEVIRHWGEVLDTIQVSTPDRAFDLLVNQWLLYQTLACRIWARTAFYQASGAFGFRDQLQDVMAIAVAKPELTRGQILKAASRQFVEGDVQHWWHEPGGRGVRTRISDDLLWLPYVVNHYLDVSSDSALLDQNIPFLRGPVLTAGELESYFQPQPTAEGGSLFEHIARALDRSLNVGAHGLPLIGTGDWNDGMNRVGAEGKGESVWLAWFLHANLKAWAPMAERRGEAQRAAAWRAHADALKVAVERDGWDGAWYRRAYFDDGTPLGTKGADACAIDAIAQTWSVMSQAADPERAAQAMASLDELLVRRTSRLSLLLTPPFDRTQMEPGYIKGYVPGVRENGGQYTHASVWAVAAFALLGDGDKAAELFAMLNPITRALTPQAVQQYRVEPYVSVGDVYSEPPHVGRGGWTWYSGSAGWMYRAATEYLLGIRVRGSKLLVNPCIPKGWPGFTAELRYHSARYHIAIENPDGVCRGVTMLELDGVLQPDLTGVALANDSGTHRIRAVLGRTP